MKKTFEAGNGLSNKDFCQEKGIGTAMFYYWQKKLVETKLERSESFIYKAFDKCKSITTWYKLNAMAYQ